MFAHAFTGKTVWLSGVTGFKGTWLAEWLVSLGRRSTDSRKSGVSCPDFSKLAAAFGLPAFQIRTWGDFDRELPRLQACTGPAICEVFMHPEQFFHPKLGVAVQPDGTLISPPLEDVSPFLSRATLAENLQVPLLPKSMQIKA